MWAVHRVDVNGCALEIGTATSKVKAKEMAERHCGITGLSWSTDDDGNMRSKKDSVLLNNGNEYHIRKLKE